VCVIEDGVVGGYNMVSDIKGLSKHKKEGNTNELGSKCEF
jgi:hypothetical protein